MAANPFVGKMAEKYDRFFETQFGRNVFELEENLLLKVLDKQDSILEIGCGTGIWMDALRKKGFNIYGVDLSKDMISYAVKKGLRRIVVSDADMLPFSDDTFDTSLFITSLEFMDAKLKAILEAARVSRKGIVVGFLNRYSLLSAYRKVKSVFRESSYRSTDFLTLNELKELVRTANKMLKGKKIRHFESYGTLKFCIDGFLKPSIERSLGSSHICSGFTVAKFYILEA